MSVSAFDKLKYLAEGKEDFVDSLPLHESPLEQQHQANVSSPSASFFSKALQYPFSLLVIFVCIVVGACFFYFFYNQGRRIHHQPQTRQVSFVKDAMTALHAQGDEEIEQARLSGRYDGEEARSAATAFTRHKQIPEYEQIPSTDDSETPAPKNQRVTWADEATGRPLEQVREIPSIRIGAEQAW